MPSTKIFLMTNYENFMITRFRVQVDIDCARFDKYLSREKSVRFDEIRYPMII